MTLTIQTVEDDLRQMTMTIEVDEARMQKAMQKKARELGREISMPGFRPGKAPYDVIVRRVGEDTLRAEAIEDLVQPVFEEALAQEGIEPYARPTLEDIQTKPVVFKFTIPLSPRVTLGDYRSYRQEVEPVTVTDEALEEAMQRVRTRHQTLETVDRPAQSGDVVVISGSGRFITAGPAAEEEQPSEEVGASGEDVIFNEERLELLLDDKTLFPDTPFVDQIVAMAAGDQKSFSFTFPDPYEHDPDYAGREAQFDISVIEVKRRDLPELDDELAKLEGSYETLDELREALRHELTHEAEDAAKEKIMDQMVDRLLEDAELVYPPAAVEAQIDDMVQDFSNRLARSGWQMDDYLKLNGMTQESLRDDFRENAERILRRQLVLRQFILDEKLRIEAADVDQLIEERVSRFENEGLRDSMRNYFRSGQGFDLISSEVLSNKAYTRVREIFSGSAPDLETLAAEAESVDEEE